ncbi:hypothetical protein AGMMS49992_15440 [Clostridia bacterium]|nr:hypothetical protein AGMMS49992_15440 [Clostridia bacterium]
MLTWNGTVAGTSAIKSYVIQYATSSDGTNWSGWSALATVTSSATFGNYSITPSNVDGMRTKYRIAVMDVLDAVSGYVESNIIRNWGAILAQLTVYYGERITQPA